jgi:AcrR family transcriptional regulator
MKTKTKILEAALALFNSRGWVNVTLRDVSGLLNISYGNVTYHYANKEKLLEAIYAEYQQELVLIGMTVMGQADHFQQMLAAPQATFELSLKYRFLFVDFLELQRQYPAFMAGVNASNQERKKGWKKQLEALQQAGFLRQDVSEFNLDFIMELSGLVRTFFFLRVQPGHDDITALKAAYVKQVNAVIWPYLSSEGLRKAQEGGYFL